jgi:hypothetical protein
MASRVLEGEKVDRQGIINQREVGSGYLYVLDVSQLEKDDAVLRVAGAICAGCRCFLEGAAPCRDKNQNKCARHIADYVRDRWGKIRAGLIGLNPAVAEMLVESLGSDNVCITDFDPRNIGSIRSGLTIRDGHIHNEDLIRQSGLILATVGTLENGSFDHIWDLIRRYEKPILFYGSCVANIGGPMVKRHTCSFERDAQQVERMTS